MKFCSIPFYFLTALLLVFASCSGKDTTVVDSDYILEQVKEDIVISPNSVLFAKSLNDLKSIIQTDVDLLREKETSFEINSLEFYETLLESAVLIEITTVNGFTSTLLLIKTNRLQREDTESYYTISCSGCDNCGVSATININTNELSYSCWESCCDMRVRHHPCR